MSEAERRNLAAIDSDDDQIETEAPVSTQGLAELARIVEAIVFASAEPVSERALAERLPANVDVAPVLRHLQKIYETRGVHLVQVGSAWAFRTAPDLAFLMSREAVQQRKLSRAAMEVLAIIAYHQPVTRAELEDIRGVETSKGTLDVLMETGWIKLRGRRRTPGRPVTYGTTDAFLDHFGLPEIRDLPGLEELRGAGLLSARMPSSFAVPVPNVDPDELTEDEEPLEDIDLESLGLLAPRGE
ncbi:MULTISPECIES: SMC-Scp complex subunit ScpB [Brucella/Ochrobactrum group]|jgi:segregation and condensation protein B|uniref:SMC-Scp complex subunit ScpB n=1 Tax=Brucella pseudintermedia TaxID=370111 RepID=A0ABY5UB74_9HYPH|nr:MULTISPECIES: SMC-Scp complex subunit ScpB [Brucella/Ochrobactrum group]KAB2680735.1 SMC-Scp complex subunit ScpB [Brucella pseudintermedia]MCO7725872.1 SMC-Scp complex subunit ScpB [Brucella intermedia]NKE77379.1 SMC-Scp complex subunit ScpB [Ochrobactrum sp. MC-1LL]TWG95742.1 segregation and condensation protein B [Ochrobactrum sp. J50]UWL60589.1 SMC-Scp complex subunit ScpB [Brucella pseudintermedia]